MFLKLWRHYLLLPEIKNVQTCITLRKDVLPALWGKKALPVNKRAGLVL